MTGCVSLISVRGAWNFTSSIYATGTFGEVTRVVFFLYTSASPTTQAQFHDHLSWVTVQPTVFQPCAVTLSLILLLSKSLSFYTPSKHFRSSSDTHTLCIPVISITSFGQRAFSFTGPTQPYVQTNLTKSNGKWVDTFRQQLREFLLVVVDDGLVQAKLLQQEKKISYGEFGGV